MQTDNTPTDAVITALVTAHDQTVNQLALFQIEILGVFIMLLILFAFVIFAAVFSVQSVGTIVKRFEREVLEVIKLLGATYKDRNPPPLP